MKSTRTSSALSHKIMPAVPPTADADGTTDSDADIALKRLLDRLRAKVDEEIAAGRYPWSDGNQCEQD